MIIDVTKSLNSSFIPFVKGNYTDPPLELTEWSSIQREGFRVSRLSLGTQSGTHIDAPAHFFRNGDSLEALPPEHFMGKYFLLNLSGAASFDNVVEQLKSYKEEKILFLRTSENQSAKLSREVMQKILSLPSILLVLSGEIENDHPFMFNRLAAASAKFLVEDLDQKEAHRISGNGEIFVFPLKLVGVSGSPCRVIVRVHEE